MSRPISAAGAAFVAIPLVAAAVIMPSGLDAAVTPLLAGGIPLAWAAFVAVALGLDPMGLAAAGLVAVPFSAYATAAFGSQPSAIVLVALLASFTAAAAAYRAAYRDDSRPGRTAGDSVRVAAVKVDGSGRPRAVASIAAGSAPGIALVSLAGPTTGAVACVATSALITAVAIYVRRRSGR